MKLGQYMAHQERHFQENGGYHAVWYCHEDRQFCRLVLKLRFQGTDWTLADYPVPEGVAGEDVCEEILRNQGVDPEKIEYLPILMRDWEADHVPGFCS